MCRLLGYVSHEKQTFNSAVGSDFSEFVTLSSVHCDGWGVATIDHNQSVAQVIRQPEAASKSQDFPNAIAQSVSDGALLHLRWATAGLPVSENNTHPFIYEDISFIHNGATYPPAALEPLISPDLIPLIQGDTDSERYFYFVITKIKELGFAQRGGRPRRRSHRHLQSGGTAVGGGGGRQSQRFFLEVPHHQGVQKHLKPSSIQDALKCMDAKCSA